MVIRKGRDLALQYLINDSKRSQINILNLISKGAGCHHKIRSMTPDAPKDVFLCPIARKKGWHIIVGSMTPDCPK